MKALRLIALPALLVLALSACEDATQQSDEQTQTPPPQTPAPQPPVEPVLLPVEGNFQLTTKRFLAGVAHTAPAPAPEGAPEGAAEGVSGSVYFSEEEIWINDTPCDRNSLEPLAGLPFDLSDPLLADAAWGVDGALGYRMVCGESGAESFIRLDDRVVLFVSANGAEISIYEKPLNGVQITALQAVLKDRKFMEQEPSGFLDEATLAALGFYYEYLGTPYRYQRPVISRAVLVELGASP